MTSDPIFDHNKCMGLILSLLLNALALIITAYLVPGFIVESPQTAIVAAIVLGLLNTFIKPLLLLLTLPLNLLTLGLFTFVINAVVLIIATYIVPGLGVDAFWPTGILAAIVLSVASTALSMLTRDIAKK